MKNLPAWCGDLFLKIHATSTINSPPISIPTSGEMMMKARILPKPSQTIGAPDCDFATVAPTRPPTSACDDDDGMP
ncbi:MAG: hypothetical protein AW08_00933 [Candidatus Accumulibacter adjunctus]|uniref:Uncharacterized protein n=1 Tax=Candidatus Accumulibacter adjunctus TaxID=1454001 RepID=A0A011N175_9PROT|nr:MAG: hypothetical protein AW08_00933 [Candidatus Accumulibacter adjunctus]